MSFLNSITLTICVSVSGKTLIHYLLSFVDMFNTQSVQRGVGPVRIYIGQDVLLAAHMAQDMFLQKDHSTNRSPSQFSSRANG